MSRLRYATLFVALLLIAAACAGTTSDPVPPGDTTATTDTSTVTPTLPVTSTTSDRSTTNTTTSSTTVASTSSALTEFLITTYDMLADRLEEQTDPDVAADPSLGLTRFEQFYEEWFALDPPPEANEMFLESITVWSALLSGYQGWVANVADAGGDETFVRLALNEFQRVSRAFARDLALVQAKQAELTISVLSDRGDDPEAAYIVEALSLDIAATEPTNRLLKALGALNSLADPATVRLDIAEAVEEVAVFADSWRALNVPPELAEMNARITDGIDTTAALYREMLATMDTDVEAFDLVIGKLQAEGRASQRLAIERLRTVASVLRGNSE